MSDTCDVQKIFGRLPDVLLESRKETAAELGVALTSLGEAQREVEALGEKYEGLRKAFQKERNMVRGLGVEIQMLREDICIRDGSIQDLTLKLNHEKLARYLKNSRPIKLRGTPVRQCLALS